jgi:ABC-type branched-subunit amino acid transport system substrate-binding protein
VPFVSSTAASAALTAPGSNWTVSVQPDPVQMGAAVAKYVSQVVPSPKIALMTQNAETQKEMAAGARWYADTYKNESVVFDEVFSNAQFPWATPAAAAKFSGANAVIVSWIPTPGFSQINVIEALLSAGFLQSQIFVVSATNQVSDLGTNATGIRGATLFDGAMAKENTNVSAFVNEVEPFIKGQTNPYIAYCGVCPTEVGSNYYYAYLGMELIINAIKNVLSSGHVLTRADFMSSLKQASIQDAFGNTLSFDAGGSSSGLYNLVTIGQPSAEGSGYDMIRVRSAGFAPGTVPAYEITKHV